jgi:hypothetical protein
MADPPPAAGKVRDPELVAWLAGEGAAEMGDTVELIVEVVSPRRRVGFRPAPGGRVRPGAVTEGGSEDDRRRRREALEALRRDLEQLLAEPPVPLRAASALAVRATRVEARQLLEHPLVRAVRLNRRRRRE